MPESASAYADAFGAQWLRFRTTQLDSRLGQPIAAERARRVIGDAAWLRLPQSRVLECGCGAGRFTEPLLAAGAHVTSIDLTEAVRANAVTCPPNARHGIAQADILRLPFRAGSFDGVFCLGVIQHTPNPEATIAALAAQVRPGGWLAIDHYARRPWWHRVQLQWVYRELLRHLAPGRALPVCERLADIFLPLHRATAQWPLLRQLLTRISPLNTHYHTLPELPEQLQRELAVLETHDALTDWFKHTRSPDEIAAAVRATGLIDVECWLGGNGVECRARRAA